VTGVRRNHVLALLLTSAALALTGCGGSSSKQTTRTPGEVMTAVKVKLDKTSGVHFVLTGKDVPTSGTRVFGAQGDLTRAPAFDGTITVHVMGITTDVPVRSVGGSVWAQIPLTTGWSKIDPATYGVPDPATLLSPTDGLSTMLINTRELKRGKSVRGGPDNKQVLTTYAGTLPGQLGKALLSSVQGDLAASYTVSDDDELSSAVLTGDFYGDGKTETYTVTVSDYGLHKTITKP
jgi:lipoprotein LprG